MKKINFSVKNFGKQNTPSLLNKISNFLLLVAGLGVIIAAAPVTTPAIALIATWTTFAGVAGAGLAKLGGEKECERCKTISCDCK